MSAHTKRIPSKQVAISRRALYRGLFYAVALFFVAGVAYLLIRASSPDRMASARMGQVENFARLVLERYGGGQFDLQRDHGEATVLVAVAYWCYSCLREVEDLATLQRELGQGGLVAVAVDIDPGSSPDKLVPFIQYANASNLTFAFDRAGDFTRQFGIQALDTTVILDASGVEVYRDQDPTPYDVLRAEIEKVLGL